MYCFFVMQCTTILCVTVHSEALQYEIMCWAPHYVYHCSASTKIALLVHFQCMLYISYFTTPNLVSHAVCYLFHTTPHSLSIIIVCHYVKLLRETL